MAASFAQDREGTGPDLQQAGEGELAPKKALRQILPHEIEEGIDALVIGFANLQHAIVGTVEVLAGAFSGQGIGPRNVGWFMVWVTLGNTVGGVVFVAFLKYGHARPAAQAATVGNR